MVNVLISEKYYYIYFFKQIKNEFGGSLDKLSIKKMLFYPGTGI